MEAAPVPMEPLTIYNLPSAPPNWDRVGVFYISFASIWTTLVLAGAAFCWINRRSPALRLRGLPLSLTAVLFLHCYWVLAQITYPIGRTMPIVLAYDIQYFFMGIYFPLGIALFQASNMRFLHIAKMQRRYVDGDFSEPGVANCNGGKSSWLCRLRNMNYTKRIMIFIGVGMVFQVLLTIGMWFACLKYHPTYGIPGTGIRGDTLPEQIVDLGRGWEWWPTVLWQFIWTWIVAPVLLWRAWGIRDTMGWRTQTIGCCLSNLHATPMFLISTYVDAFAPVNAYYHPSQWIHLSIMMFEIFTIFLPAFQAIKLSVLARRAAKSSAKWGSSDSQTTFTLRISTSTQDIKAAASSTAEKGRCSSPTGQMVEYYLDSAFGDRLLTMAALERVLAENPRPLQDFSALSDFSGENIAFLTRTTAWKNSSFPVMPLSPTIYEEGGQDQLSLAPPQELFNQALDIYIDFISPHHAAFPLNISSQSLRSLEDIFKAPAEAVRGDGASTADSAATPFDMPVSRPSTSADRSASNYIGDVPAEFTKDVFDEVIESIKYLVLTNTWPKFVAEMQARHRQRQRRSGETERSASSGASSQQTLVEKVTQTFRSLL